MSETVREASPHAKVQHDNAMKDIQHYADLYGVRYPDYEITVEVIRAALRKRYSARFGSVTTAVAGAKVYEPKDRWSQNKNTTIYENR